MGGCQGIVMLLLRGSKQFLVYCYTAARVFCVVSTCQLFPNCSERVNAFLYCCQGVVCGCQDLVNSSNKQHSDTKYSKLFFQPMESFIRGGWNYEFWIWYNSGLRHFLIPFSPLLLIISCPLSTVPSIKMVKRPSISLSTPNRSPCWQAVSNDVYNVS